VTAPFAVPANWRVEKVGIAFWPRIQKHQQLRLRHQAAPFCFVAEFVNWLKGGLPSNPQYFDLHLKMSALRLAITKAQKLGILKNTIPFLLLLILLLGIQRCIVAVRVAAVVAVFFT
jgi:hypothetical protein